MSVRALARIMVLAAVLAPALTDVASPREAEASSLAPLLVASGFARPLGIVDPGDGTDRLFVVEQTGKVRIIEDGIVRETPFIDVSALITNPAAFEQGLLGLVFHPQYGSNGVFFITYTDPAGSAVFARYRVSEDPNVADPLSAEIILTVEQPEPTHNSGQLAFGPDGYLYIGLGDGGGVGDPHANAQNLETLRGSILRIDVDGAAPYEAPASNPLVGVAGRDEIFSYGLRNPWRFSFDRLTGDLFIADVGQFNVEEIDFIAAGDVALKNFGWPIMEGASCYSPPSGCDSTGLTMPIVAYQHDVGCSITGGYRYRGGDASMYGKYIYGDFCSGRIWSATESGGAWSSQMELDTPMLISSFGEDADGELYVADWQAGRVYLITHGVDSDGDGVADFFDNCVDVPNPGQENADANFVHLPSKLYNDLTWPNSDELGDTCDHDDDNDGIPDVDEPTFPVPGCPTASATLDPLRRDTDGDGVLDRAECMLGYDPADANSTPPGTIAQDADGDGLPDWLETMLGTSPTNPDTDGDRILDGVEVRYYNSNPLTQNTDGDACPDGKEVASINDDTSVNSIDLSQVAQSFGLASSGKYIRTFDTNGDWNINSLDLLFVALSFGSC